MMHYWKVRLRTLTSTFIGSGEIYKKSQYIYHEDNRTVCFLKEEKWISFLAEHDIMDDFASELVKGGARFDLFGYLKNQCILQRKYGSIRNVIRAMEEAGAIDREVDYRSVGKDKGPNDIAAHIKDAEGNPYIPGSSLKGAFRTAILSHEIRKNLSRYRATWAKLERAAGDKKEMGRIVDQLERDMGISDGKDMVKSYFRGLTVSDAVLKKGKLCVAAKADLSVGDDDIHQVSLYRECLDDAALEFTVGIDDSEAGMGHFDIKSFADLQKVLQEFVDFQYDILEKPFRRNGDVELQDIKNHQNADFLLGGGTGFLTKTLIYSLAPDRGQAIYVTRKLMEKMFRKHYHHEDREISPHTLKLVSLNGNTYLMGLCYLEEEKKLC